jgi:hypothetical protein
VVFLGLTGAPASAHTISGPKPTNYHSRVVEIAPAVPGITARVVDLGSKIELTNRTSTEITVLGYESEPYLRIGPDGVFENQNSQATYINRTRTGGTVPPDIDTSPTAPPQWKKISDDHSARWHDHRIHWMSPQPPPPVAESPGSFHHLSQQNIVFLRNGERVGIAVSLDWVPGPSGVPWIPPLVVLFVVGLLGAAVPRWWRVLAVLVGLLVLADVAHAVGFEIPRPGGNPAKLLQFFGGSFVSIAVWIAAVPTVVALTRRRVEALYGVLFVALLIALVGGATDLSALWNSQLPDAGPAWLTRAEVVVALGLGGGLVVGALARMVRSRGRADAEGSGRWLSLLVAGLSDVELTRIARELDADEVMEVALAELSTRAAPVAGDLAGGSVAFVVTDQDAPVAWSIASATGEGAGLRPARGAVEPVAAEICAPFAPMLQLFAGTLRFDDAIARSVITTTGDASIVARLAPYLPETATITGTITGTGEDRAPAS